MLRILSKIVVQRDVAATERSAQDNRVGCRNAAASRCVDRGNLVVHGGDEVGNSG